MKLHLNIVKVFLKTFVKLVSVNWVNVFFCFLFIVYFLRGTKEASRSIILNGYTIVVWYQFFETEHNFLKSCFQQKLSKTIFIYLTLKKKLLRTLLMYECLASSHLGYFSHEYKRLSKKLQRLLKEHTFVVS